MSVLSVEGGDLASVANDDAVPVELPHEVVGHRLAEVCAAMEECHERAPAREPDGCLPGRVASPYHRHTRPGAELRLRSPGGVEDRQPLELLEAVDREPPVLGACREQHGTCCDLLVVLEADEVAPVSRLQCECAV